MTGFLSSQLRILHLRGLPETMEPGETIAAERETGIGTTAVGIETGTTAVGIEGIETGASVVEIEITVGTGTRAKIGTGAEITTEVVVVGAGAGAGAEKEIIEECEEV